MRCAAKLSYISVLVVLYTLTSSVAFAALETGTVTEDFGSTGRKDDRGTYAFWSTREKEAVLPLNATVRNLATGLQGFARQTINAIATDGTSVLVSGSTGALNLVNEQGIAQDFTAAIASKTRRINALGFIQSRGVWIVGGEAKTGQGAMLYTIMQGSGAAVDFQIQAKAAELDRIDRIECSADVCRVFGVKGFTSARAASFDGTTVARLETIPPSSVVPVSEVAPRFSRMASRIRQNAIAEEDGALTYVVGGGIFVNLSGGIEISAGYIPELQGADVRVLLKRSERQMLLGGVFRGAPLLLDISIQGFVPSASVESKTIASAGRGKFFKAATLIAEAEITDGTSISYFLSADGGQHFEEVTAGVAHGFINKSDDLRFRAILNTSNSTRTPRLLKVRVEFTKQQEETLATLRARDNERISKFKDIANRLEKFKKDRNAYPIAQDRMQSVRWNLLSQLLIEGKYVTAMPVDPKADEDQNYFYDYISSTGGNAYILRARLEEADSRHSASDADGKPVEPNLYDYTCDEPWYCIGKGFTVPSSVEAPPSATGTAEAVVSDDGRVWRIASIGGGSTPVQKRKLYIPSPAVVKRLKSFYTRMQQIGRAQIEEIPRARLIKSEDKADVFYLTETFLKRRIPSWDVFLAYGNDPKEIVTVKSEELQAFGDSRLIRLEGDNRVWYLENGVRRLVSTPAVFKKHGFEWKQVSPVNFPEYNSYPDGAPLE